MKITELIKKLQDIQKVHGNLPVFINDADTKGFDDQGWNLEISNIIVCEENEGYENPKRLLIGGDYD